MEHSGRIRLARAGDRAAVVDCVTAAFGVFIPRIGKPPAPMLADYAALIARRQVHVVEDEGVVAAVIVLVAEIDHLFVDVVAVRPRRQRQDLGRRLMAFAAGEARRRGLSEIRLYTHEVMSGALGPLPGARLSGDRAPPRGWLCAGLPAQSSRR